MKINYEFIRENKFPHRFYVHTLKKEERNELVDWLKECGNYNTDYIYWGLKKQSEYSATSEIFLKDNIICMAFKLRWL